MSRAKKILKVVLGLAMIGVGISHFTSPEGFVRIVPAYLPAPLVLVYISGFFEMAGGIGLLVPRTQRAAAWGLVALYVSVFPANLNMALNHIQIDPAAPIPVWAMWARLPFQILFIAWAYWFTRPEGAPATPDGLTRPGAPRPQTSG